MNISQSALIQATVEIFATIIMVVMGILLSLITKLKKNSAKSMLIIIIFAGVDMLADACCFIFNGNTSHLGYIINYGANLLVFISNIVQLLAAAHFIRFMVLEKKGNYPKIYFKLSCFILTAALLMAFSNIFTDWVYTIDDSNNYSRSVGWYVYATAAILALFILIMLVEKTKNILSFSMRATLHAFLVAPFLAAVLQSVFYGFSFIQVGLLVSIMLILLVYIWEWNKEGKNDYQNTASEMRVIITIFVIMILCLSASVGSCAVSLHIMASKASTEQGRLIANEVSEKINLDFNEPIIVSDTMSNASVIQNSISKNEPLDADVEKELIDYLVSVKEKFSYESAFFVSDSNRAYYTADGLLKYLDDNNPKDVWYAELINSSSPYILNVDHDESNEMNQSIFVNTKVFNSSGEFIGVCGVVMSIEQLMKHLAEFESFYHVNVTLVNSSGVVQLDTNPDIIEQFTLDNSYFTEVSNEGFHYKSGINTSIYTRYMDNLNWYLIVEDLQPARISILSLMAPSLSIYFMGIILLLFFMRAFLWRNKQQKSEILKQTLLSEIDNMTGILNRYAFELARTSAEESGLTGNQVFFLFDINGLKNANDTIGHDAGDELIIGTVECIKKIFWKYGFIYRVGGDEIAAVLDIEKEKLPELISSFKELVNSWHGKLTDSLSVSVGYACCKDYPDQSFSDLFRIADEKMYEEKRQYYETHERRRH